MRRLCFGGAALLALAAMMGAQAAQATVDYSKITPDQLVKETPKGGLHNPYKDTDKKIVEEGHQEFLSHGCNGCHGGGGGGGMCPPLINSVWVYGGDDDTLFRQITLGSDQMQKDGYARIGVENVVGPMPPMGPLIKNANMVWEIITWIRSVYNGDPGNKYGQQEAAQVAAEGPTDASAKKADAAGAGGESSATQTENGTVHSVPLDNDTNGS